MRLGTKQLELLRNIGTTSALVVPCATSRRLRDLGLLRAAGQDGDSLFCITPAGLRALADAVDAGRIELFTMVRAALAERSEG